MAVIKVNYLLLKAKLMDEANCKNTFYGFLWVFFKSTFKLKKTLTWEIVKKKNSTDSSWVLYKSGLQSKYLDVFILFY